MITHTITITTDFGDQFAASQLRAVIASEGFSGHVIENHSVTPFSISEGAFEIKQIAAFSPSGSVHVGVIDPGVGSDRWGIIIETKRSFYVGPNNGILHEAANKEGIQRVWRIRESAFGDHVATTFHGRDVFIKAAIRLTKRKNPRIFAKEISPALLKHYSFSEGEVVHIDAYGNYKIYWSDPIAIGKKLVLTTKKKKEIIIPIVKTFDSVPAHSPLAYMGSHGTLEIAINLSNAARVFGFLQGEKLIIKQM